MLTTLYGLFWLAGLVAATSWLAALQVFSLRATNARTRGLLLLPGLPLLGVLGLLAYTAAHRLWLTGLCADWRIYIGAWVVASAVVAIGVWGRGDGPRKDGVPGRRRETWSWKRSLRWLGAAVVVQAILVVSIERRGASRLEEIRQDARDFYTGLDLDGMRESNCSAPLFRAALADLPAPSAWPSEGSPNDDWREFIVQHGEMLAKLREGIASKTYFLETKSSEPDFVPNADADPDPSVCMQLLDTAAVAHLALGEIKEALAYADTFDPLAAQFLRTPGYGLAGLIAAEGSVRGRMRTLENALESLTPRRILDAWTTTKAPRWGELSQRAFWDFHHSTVLPLISIALGETDEADAMRAGRVSLSGALLFGSAQFRVLGYHEVVDQQRELIELITQRSKMELHKWREDYEWLSRPMRGGSEPEATGLHRTLAISLLKRLSRSRVRRDLLRLGTAAVCCFDARGAYPSSLKELLPDFLQSLPTDPSSGDRYRLFIVDHGLIIYSTDFDQVVVKDWRELLQGEHRGVLRRPPAIWLGSAHTLREKWRESHKKK